MRTGDENGICFRQARPVVFSGNVVAGCPDIGVLMRPETCEAVEQDAETSDIIRYPLGIEHSYGKYGKIWENHHFRLGKSPF